jgi:hypothetical protein
MARIFLTEIDSTRDRGDLDKSLLNAVDRQLIIRNFSDATYPELIDIERRGHGFYVWGLPPGDENVENWFVMAVGDLVLMGEQGQFSFYAKVLGRYQNAKVAQAIWGDDVPPEQQREHLFFLSEPVPLQLPYRDLAEYFPAEFSGFTRISDEAMSRIEGDFGSVDRFARRRLLNTSAGGPILDMSGMVKLSERDLARLQVFDPQNGKDGRQAIVETIIRRRGQPHLRQVMLDAYEQRCAVTNFTAADALEIAYIVPFRGKFTHTPSNALLLRADIHTLFDLGKIAVDTRTMTMVIAEDLAQTSYRILAGRPLRYPKDESHRPSSDGLDLHRRLSGL